MGWVIQDTSNSTRSRSFSSHRRFVSSALVAECYFTEALALRSALSLLAANTDANPMVIYSDSSQSLISLVNSKGCVTELRSILHDIFLLSENFSSISFVFVPRSHNGVTDALAKMALLSLTSTSFKYKSLLFEKKKQTECSQFSHGKFGFSIFVH